MGGSKVTKAVGGVVEGWYRFLDLDEYILLMFVMRRKSTLIVPGNLSTASRPYRK